MKPDTLAIHAARQPDPATGAIAPPIVPAPAAAPSIGPVSGGSKASIWPRADKAAETSAIGVAAPATRSSSSGS